MVGPNSAVVTRRSRPNLVRPVVFQRFSSLPTEGDRLDELLYVGLTRATTELVVIAPPALAGRLG